MRFVHPYAVLRKHTTYKKVAIKDAIDRLGHKGFVTSPVISKRMFKTVEEVKAVIDKYDRKYGKK